MLSALLGFLGGVAVLSIVYFVRKQKGTNPALCWPRIAEAAELSFKPNPPTIEGRREGRAVAVTQAEGGVRIILALNRPSRLRIEVGPKALVTKRAGIVVPDAVPTGDYEFDERFLVRCADKAAGERMINNALRPRLCALEAVDFVGQGTSIQWTVPEVIDSGVLEEILDCMTSVAAEMEACPA